MITTTIEWFKPDEKLPDKDGEYFALVSRPICELKTIRFAKNLHEFDRLDFPEESDARPGFFDIDCNRGYWYAEIPLSNILYWAKIPEIKEETKDD